MTSLNNKQEQVVTIYRKNLIDKLFSTVLKHNKTIKFTSK